MCDTEWYMIYIEQNITTKKSANETVASYLKFTKSRGQTILLQHWDEEVHYMESINISIPEY